MQNWLGNRDETELRISAAKDKLTRIKLQIQSIFSGATGYSSFAILWI